MKNKLYNIIGVALVSAFVFAGCGITQSDSDRASEVQVRMQAQSTNSASKQFGAAQDSHGIVINEVKLFIEEMELESVENDSLDFEIENFIVNLPLDGSSLILAEITIPVGLYDEFEFEIEKPDDLDVQVNDPDFRDETGSYSLVVKGLFNGEEFMFRSSEDFEIDIDLNPVLEITEESASLLLITIDLDSWFKDSNGHPLDPKDPNNTELINENIERSFEAFEDQFEDDDDDDDDDDEDDDE